MMPSSKVAGTGSIGCGGWVVVVVASAPAGGEEGTRFVGGVAVVVVVGAAVLDVAPASASPD